jgi:uncharacterized phage protein gp47/JayE
MAMQSFRNAVSGGLEEAKALERFMMTLLKSMQDHQSEIASSHEVALRAAAQNIHTEAEVFVSQIATAVLSFAALQGDIVSIPVNRERHLVLTY